MKSIVTIHRANGPVYQQIAAQIKQAIISGEIKETERLPTVRELADTLGIARGTVKHAYDALEQQNLITMVQGRGTFVKEGHTQEGRKDAAMQAIDQLLDYLQTLDFTPREIAMFLDLKMREKEEKNHSIRMLVIECNVEAKTLLATRIGMLSEVEVVQASLSDILRGFAGFDEDYDLIITTKTHAEQVQQLMQESKKLIPIVMTPSHQTAMHLGKIQEHQTIGVVAASDKFASLMVDFINRLSLPNAKKIFLFSEKGLEAFLNTVDLLLLPQDYLKFCSSSEQDAILAFIKQGKSVLYFNYQIDDGSLYHLQQSIKQIKEEKE